MNRVRASENEWFPVYTIHREEPRHWSDLVLLTDGEIARIEAARVEHDACQQIIREGKRRAMEERAKG